MGMGLTGFAVGGYISRAEFQLQNLHLGPWCFHWTGLRFGLALVYDFVCTVAGSLGLLLQMDWGQCEVGTMLASWMSRTLGGGAMV